MGFHGFFADPEQRRNHLVDAAFREELQDFSLAGRQGIDAQRNDGLRLEVVVQQLLRDLPREKGLVLGYRFDRCDDVMREFRFEQVASRSRSEDIAD